MHCIPTMMVMHQYVISCMTKKFPSVLRSGLPPLALSLKLRTMAGACSCLANNSSVVASLPWRSKPRAKNLKQTNCFLPPTRSTLRCPEQYPSLRISTPLQIRLEHVKPLKILSSAGKPKSSSTKNDINAFQSSSIEPPEDSDNSNVQGGENSWISLLKHMACTVWSSVNKPWIVPWGYATIFLFDILSTNFKYSVATKILPLFPGLETALVNIDLLTISSGLVSMITLYLCVFRYRPFPPGLFHFSFKGNWIFDVAAGCLLSPLIDRLYLVNYKFVGYIPPVGNDGWELSIMYRDYPAMALNLLVHTVLVPLYEEIVYRGFLLPSLSRYMPVPCSIALSSVIFALHHHEPACFLPLASFGLMVGVIVARTRNLLPAVILHGLSNMLVDINFGRYWISKHTIVLYSIASLVLPAFSILYLFTQLFML